MDELKYKICNLENENRLLKEKIDSLNKVITALEAAEQYKEDRNEIEIYNVRAELKHIKKFIHAIFILCEEAYEEQNV